MQVEGKNILITGSNRGIGLAMAKEAAKRNMKIHLVNRSDNKEMGSELRDLGAAEVKSWVLDMSLPKNIDKFVEEFKKSNFTCEILMNNAGQLTGGLLEEQGVEKIYQMFQVNLVGLIHLTRLMLPEMLKLPEAKIINNSRVSGIMFLPCASTYAASKAGVIAFTESLRNELQGTNVSNLVMITPGVKTRMFEEIPELYSSHVNLDFMASIPAEKWVKKVFNSVEKDESVCWPQGKTLVGVKMGQHFPKLLSRVVGPYFKR